MPGIRVTYYLFAPQGSGEAESLTPLKRRTTPLLKATHSLSAHDLRVYDGGSHSSKLSLSAVHRRLIVTNRRFDKLTERDKIEKLPSGPA